MKKATAPVETTKSEPITSQRASTQATTQISETDAKAYIYFKESSNNLSSVNSGGCKGLGQDCNGQLVKDCPNWQTDYACQDKFFTNYVKGRYGSWVAAYEFWCKNNWY